MLGQGPAASRPSFPSLHPLFGLHPPHCLPRPDSQILDPGIGDMGLPPQPGPWESGWGFSEYGEVFHL